MNPMSKFIEEKKRKIEKIRRCPICNNILLFSQAIKYNITFNERYILRKIWNDDRVAIPCCECSLIMHQIKNKGYSRILLSLYEHYNDRVYLMKSNLRKFGVI